MERGRKFAANPNVVARQVGDETVMLDLESGTYLGLDPVGARIWELIGENKTLGQVCEIMLAEYEVSSDVLERDVDRLIEDLLDNNVIRAS